MRQTILVINEGYRGGQVYLRYVGNGKEGWRRAGSHGALIRNYPRRHDLTRLGGKTFLRVASQGGHGSDLSSETESWIDLTQPDFEPVFVFSPQGFRVRHGFGVSRTIHATATPRLRGGRETIDVRLEVQYSGRDFKLSRGVYTATYERRPQQRAFTLRNNKEFEDLMNLNEGPTNEQMLVHALAGLKAVASGKNAEPKDWLRFMLVNCKDTPEKRMLLDLLAQK